MRALTLVSVLLVSCTPPNAINVGPSIPLLKDHDVGDCLYLGTAQAYNTWASFMSSSSFSRIHNYNDIRRTAEALGGNAVVMEWDDKAAGQAAVYYCPKLDRMKQK